MATVNSARTVGKERLTPRWAPQEAKAELSAYVSGLLLRAEDGEPGVQVKAVDTRAQTAGHLAEPDRGPARAAGTVAGAALPLPARSVLHEALLLALQQSENLVQNPLVSPAG